MRRERFSDETTRLLAAVPEDRAGHRHSPGKWSIKEVVGHVADVERMTSFRAFTFAIGDRTGVASGCRFTVRSLVYVLLGHELHHRQVLRERYL